MEPYYQGAILSLYKQSLQHTMHSQQSFSDGNDIHVPSLWPLRRERRQLALTRDMGKIESRLKQIEDSIAAFSKKLETVLSTFGSPSLTCELEQEPLAE